MRTWKLGHVVERSPLYPKIKRFSSTSAFICQLSCKHFKLLTSHQMLAIVLEFINAFQNIGKRFMARTLFKTVGNRRCPTLGQFLKSRDIDISVMEIAFKSRHPTSHKTTVLTDRIAAHRTFTAGHKAGKFSQKNVACAFFIDIGGKHSVNET